MQPRYIVTTHPVLYVLVILVISIFSATAPRAESVCVEPSPPAPINGATATLDQMHAAVAAAKQYLADSDLFQNCLVNEVSATDIKQDAAKEAALQKELDKRTLANQARKESVGTAINTAIADYDSFVCPVPRASFSDLPRGLMLQRAAQGLVPAIGQLLTRVCWGTRLDHFCCVI